ncbi:MAG: hypothetical protein OQK12_07695 [Motiliproteus sp.]|nr:hypothetical protein [Motiliproteus sp.]MCW9051793.1 hypothetical protein [Motiliproteus sp.]
MSASEPEKNNRSITYHIFMGLGFLALVAWFYLMRKVGFIDWVTAQGPSTHTGAMNMLAIMIWMLPGFFCWKYYVRFLNKKLNIRGMYYEDHYYGKVEDQPATKGAVDDSKKPDEDNDSSNKKP